MKGESGYQRAERKGRLAPVAGRVFAVLQATPGVVTDSALHSMVWRDREQPSSETLRTYVNHIKRVMGIKIRRHRGVGYEIVRNVT